MVIKSKAIIPNGWNISTFGDILEGFFGGATPRRNHPEYYNGKIKWVTSGELDYNIIYDTIEKISLEGKEKTNLMLLPPGAFLMAITGLEASGTRGRCAILGIEATTNQSCLAIFSTNKMITEYLYYYYLLKGDELAFKYCQGTKQQSYTSKIVKSLPIMYPENINEQKKISLTLRNIDDLTQQLEKLIIKKKRIKQGTMQQLLTGKKRLPGFSGEWEVKKLGNISDIRTGKKNNDDKSNDGIYPFFVRSQTVERINSYSFDGEAILIPGEGGIGSIYHYIDGKFDYHQRVYKISSFEGVLGKFIYYFIKQNFSTYAMQNTVKATVDSLRLPTFEEFEIHYPNSTVEQKLIVNILTDMDSEIEALEQKLEKYKKIKQGMMQELLTGRIRLI